MLTIFSRRERITVISLEKLFNIREALSAAGIDSYTRFLGAGAAASNRSRGFPARSQDAAYTYKIYVHKTDYDRAFAVIQTALRG